MPPPRVLTGPSKSRFRKHLKTVSRFPSQAGIMNLRSPTVSDECTKGLQRKPPGRAVSRGILVACEGVILFALKNSRLKRRTIAAPQ